ncbi:MAG: OadG family protein [Lachnospiraceae bacterium]|nr:OadG family protein [Lachnospiraceae bacterium]
MKKFLALLCMIACIFGLTACGGEETLTEYEQKKVEIAQQLADQIVTNLLADFMDDSFAGYYDGYTAEEIEYMVANTSGLMVDGYAFSTAIDSFHSAKASMGLITGTTGSSASISGKQIIVEVEVTGEKKNAVAEIIFSNDQFLKLESASLNPVSTMGELMGRAALNTLIGMGTVFIVLILISLIISSFKLIAKVQENAAKKAVKESAPEVAGIDNALAQIEEQEAMEETDDLELVAVIAAAAAAYEGAASTDGFVVRSIRRR